MKKKRNKPGQGRKVIVYGEREAKIIEEWGPHCTRDQIAILCGVTPVTQRNVFARQPDFKYLLDRCSTQKIAMVSSMLFDKCLDGDTASIIFFLKTRGGDLYKVPVESSTVVNVVTGAKTVHRFDGSTPEGGSDG